MEGTKAVCSATDPGTSSKAFVVTVQHKGASHYYHFEMRWSAQSLVDRINGAKSSREATEWITAYDKSSFAKR